MQTTYSSSPAYGRLLTACHIYLTCHYECYINYNELGNRIFRWLLDAKDLTELRSLPVPKQSKFLRIVGYETQVIAQEFMLPATLVSHAFTEVISNEFNRSTGQSTRG